ncbi:Histone-lysine N-methyltransferase, H3 lysine-79 specific [Sarracenia purpurea var. burkii]
MVDFMKTDKFKQNIEAQIAAERERNQRLNSRTEQLDKQINLLIEDSVGERDHFPASELQAKALKLQSKVSSCDGNVYVGGKFDELVSIWVDEELIGGNDPMVLFKKVATLEDKHVKLWKNVNKTNERDADYGHLDSHFNSGSVTTTSSSGKIHNGGITEHILKEIQVTLEERKKLQNYVSKYEKGLQDLERDSSPLHNERDSTSICAAASSAGTYGSHQSNGSKHHHSSSSGGTGGSRKSRSELRTKNQEWPEIPEIEKIDEKNPEILAMKILESGRQIEANKMKYGLDSSIPRSVSGRNIAKVSTGDRSYPATASAKTSTSMYPGTTPAGTIRKEPLPGPVPESQPRLEIRIRGLVRVNRHRCPDPVFEGNCADLKGNAGLPDYTQVSPAKLALRRHLSQEKIAPAAPAIPPAASQQQQQQAQTQQQQQQQPSNFIGTRTIGDLVSAAANATNPKNEFAESLIQQKNQAYSSAATKQENTYTISFAGSSSKNSRSSVLYSTTNSQQSVPYSKYSTVHLPRAEMKPYHESYFTDMKPPTKEEPVEGLAASLQDRLFNGLSNGGPSNQSNDDQDYRSKNSSNGSSPAMGSSQQLPTNMAYEIKTEPGIHLKRPVRRIP